MGGHLEGVAAPQTTSAEPNDGPMHTHACCANQLQCIQKALLAAHEHVGERVLPVVPHVLKGSVHVPLMDYSVGIHHTS